MKRSIPCLPIPCLLAAAAAMFLSMPATTMYAADRDVPRVVREARKVEESKREAEFTAKEDGQVWLVDMTDGERPLHSITLREGQRYGFDTRNNYVTVNGKQGGRVNFDRDHTYAIFFATAAARDARNEREGEREERRSKNAERARVPDTAEVVAEGRDKELSYVAKSDGMVFLYDASESRLIESWRLEQGKRITVSPKSNAIAIDQKTTSRDIELSRRTTYRLLFDRKTTE